MNKLLASSARGLFGLADPNQDYTVVANQINSLLAERANAIAQYPINHYGGMSSSQFQAYIGGIDTSVTQLKAQIGQNTNTLLPVGYQSPAAAAAGPTAPAPPTSPAAAAAGAPVSGPRPQIPQPAAAGAMSTTEMAAIGGGALLLLGLLMKRRS